MKLDTGFWTKACGSLLIGSGFVFATICGLILEQTGILSLLGWCVFMISLGMIAVGLRAIFKKEVE